MKHIVAFVATVAWIVGLIIAKGFWSTLIAFVFPVWAWYLTVELILNTYVFVV